MHHVNNYSVEDPLSQNCHLLSVVSHMYVPVGFGMIVLTMLSDVGEIE